MRLVLVTTLTTLFAVVGCSSSSGAPVTPAHDAGADAFKGTKPGDAGTKPDTGAQDATPPVDAPPDVDNGAPSTTYPAPHPPLPQLVNLQGGPVLKTPTVYMIFYPYVADLQTFATNVAASTYWPGATSEYGVGTLTVGTTITLTGQTAPTMITQAQIETWVGTQIASGAFGTPDPEGIYTIFYPETTTITQPDPVLSGLPPVVSCVGFGGYHDNVAVALTDGGTSTNFSYAVIPTCDTQVDDLTAAVSHEWIESATDPFLTASTAGAFSLFGGPDSAFFTVDADHAIWAILGGGEAGDLCEPEGNSAYITPSDIGFLVQRTWSNMLASASHDPCAPDPASTPFFAGAPVLTEAESVVSTLIGGTINTQGVTIPVGTSKTIEVDLFSDADTNGPFTVAATDTLATSYNLTQTLAFSWDRTMGVNGEKLHLTITVTNESIIDGVHVFSITASQGSQQFVWSGLVME